LRRVCLIHFAPAVPVVGKSYQVGGLDAFEAGFISLDDFAPEPRRLPEAGNYLGAEEPSDKPSE